MRKTQGPAELALAAALRDLADEGKRTPCNGSGEWIGNTTEDHAKAREGCEDCPLSIHRLCAAAAAEMKPTAGTWAGKTYDKPERKRKAA